MLCIDKTDAALLGLLFVLVFLFGVVVGLLLIV